MENTRAYKVFANLAEMFRAGRGKKLVANVARVICVRVISDDGVPYEFTLNLCYGWGSVDPGRIGKPDLTLSLSDQEFEQIYNGEQMQMLSFLQGKLKLEGDITGTMKFGLELLSKL
jgi:hypothetical protein